jgi:hypothetical protein
MCVLLDIGLGKLYIYYGIIKPAEEEILLKMEEEKEEKEKLPRTELIVKIVEEKKFLPCKIVI